jgi:uncharacterized protein YacL
MKKILRVILALVGASVGAAVAVILRGLLTDFNLIPKELPFGLLVGVYAVLCVAGAVLFVMLSGRFFQLLDKAEQVLRAAPMADIVAGVVGLVIGLLLALLVSQLAFMLPFRWLSITISIFIYALLGYLGLNIAMNRRHELNLVAFVRKVMANRENRAEAQAEEQLSQKLLDTSVIIDGRIYEICKAGFLEGRLVVPSFVLDELRAVSDSEDDLKRGRGRRGLDILARLQHELSRPVTVLNRDYPELPDVDSKLLKLAAELGAKIVTNDYNLNKVARVQNIKVLNINELSNAVKPVALPGEEMTVKIVKAGKEAGQGVAYLEDGTMIVVEGGLRYIDETVQILVTSSLQTSAGRMIFGKLA